ncbi:NAD(P)-binding protein [Kribbella sp. NBC_01505]|uniref:FAD-dependent oxidoreductase n=1 Tax=Kribbella sp. NBC_01505 TaxID=2903580 RepID=UPI0038705AAE
MDLTRKDLLKLAAAAGVAAGLPLQTGTANATERTTSTGHHPVIERDVAIIGGGSTGTYAAIRLRDLGKSVVVIERKDRLGGHTEKYVDPASGASFNMGVVVWHNLPVAHSYLNRLGVPFAVGSIGGGSGGSTGYVDFRTGKLVPDYRPPAPTQLPVLRDLIDRYPYLEHGFELPNPVPAELLMPWGDFLAKHSLDTLPGLVANFGQGLGDIMNQPTLYVMKNFGSSLISDLLNNTFLNPVSTNTHEIYEKAALVLGDDVLLSSEVTHTHRGHGVLLRVDTPDGPRVIRAKKLVITAPPLPSSLSAVDLDGTELSLFKRFRPGFYYTGVVRIAGLPAKTSLQNVGSDTVFNLPPLPGIYGLTQQGPADLYQVKYGSDRALTDAQVQANVLADLNRLRTAGAYPVTAAKFEAYSSHSPFELTVSVADIKKGFYRRLSALQGHRNTFYTGGAFHTQDSAMLWRFTETLIPRIRKSLHH